MEQDEYFAYDILEIPEDIQKMSKDELKREISRLEAKAAEKRKRSQHDRKVEK